MINATTSALLQQIAMNLKPLETLGQPISLAQIIGAVISFLVGSFVALAALVIKERYELSHKSNINPIKCVPAYQEPEGNSGGQAQWIYRLEFVNDSRYVANNVDMYVQEVYDDGNILRKNFIPSPLRWTHRDSKPRDIFPHQTVLLDLFEIKFRQQEPIILAAPNLDGLKSIKDIKAGKTCLILKYYQENGQIGYFEVVVEWNGEEPLIVANKPESKGNLPKISHFSHYNKKEA